MKKLIVVLGPTAVGKTAYAIRLAQSMRTEIISADSRQIYKELNIGAARPSVDELKTVPHHFIATASIRDEYSAGRYEREALATVHDLFQRHDTLVCCGGSMLYVDALINGLDELPKDKEVRTAWSNRLRDEGIGVLQEALQEVDPVYHAQVDLQNPHRLIRALEVCTVSGKKFSDLRLASARPRDFEVEKIGLHMPREKLYRRIDERVDVMMEAGLLSEVEALLPHRSLQALNTVGYKELFDYFDGQCSLEEAVTKIKQHTRNFAKRQLTWWRRDQSIRWEGQ
jgi:tRNA dimethylallyltransferase